MIATVPQAAIALRNVLIATDFSPCSERALLHAVAAAHHFGSTLHLVHIVHPAMFSICPPEAYMGITEAENLALNLALADTQKMVADVLHRTHCEDVQYRTYARLGAPGEMLRSIIEREHIDLAVVGTHGRTGLRKIVMGSVAEDVFRHASCPVLTVGPYSWRSAPQSIRLGHVLFPTDLSAESASALPFVMAIAAEFGANLTMLHVIERLEGEAAHDRLRVVAALEEQMRQIASGVEPMPPKTTFQVEFGDIAEVVMQAATGLEVDLIAFGLKPPSTYVDRLPWMNAYKIVCEASCPVLSLHGAFARQ